MAAVKNVLLVATSAAEMGGGPTGLWLSESATVYVKFEQHCPLDELRVICASPNSRGRIKTSE